MLNIHPKKKKTSPASSSISSFDYKSLTFAQVDKLKQKECLTAMRENGIRCPYDKRKLADCRKRIKSAISEQKHGFSQSIIPHVDLEKKGFGFGTFREHLTPISFDLFYVTLHQMHDHAFATHKNSPSNSSLITGYQQQATVSHQYPMYQPIKRNLNRIFAPLLEYHNSAIHEISCTRNSNYTKNSIIGWDPHMDSYVRNSSELSMGIPINNTLSTVFFNNIVGDDNHTLCLDETCHNYGDNVKWNKFIDKKFSPFLGLDNAEQIKEMGESKPMEVGEYFLFKSSCIHSSPEIDINDQRKIVWLSLRPISREANGEVPEGEYFSLKEYLKIKQPILPPKKYKSMYNFCTHKSKKTKKTKKTK